MTQCSMFLRFSLTPLCRVELGLAPPGRRHRRRPPPQKLPWIPTFSYLLLPAPPVAAAPVRVGARRAARRSVAADAGRLAASGAPPQPQVQVPFSSSLLHNRKQQHELLQIPIVHQVPAVRLLLFNDNATWTALVEQMMFFGVFACWTFLYSK